MARIDEYGVGVDDPLQALRDGVLFGRYQVRAEVLGYPGQVERRGAVRRGRPQ
mgnify:CR=1 FL=1